MTHTVSITHQDLPLSCPKKEASVTFEHPRVYLALDAHNQVTCPYCQTRYQLVEK